jgi:uncharacterized protein
VACAAQTADPFPVAEISIDNVDLTVWVADDGPERRQGLRGLEQLPAGIDGMLFIYERAENATFVMEDTLIPLDVWWFDVENRLIGANAMSPCESRECGDYPSPGPVAKVLETPAGQQDFEVGVVVSTGANR